VKNKHIIISALLLIAVQLSGQVKQYEFAMVQQIPLQYVVGELYKGDLQSDTYLNPDWIEGDLLLESGDKISNAFLRYNGLTDELFWREPVLNNVIKVDKESVKGFHFNYFRGDSTVFFTRMKIKKDFVSDSASCFLQEIDFNKIKLFIYHSRFFLRKENYSVNGKISMKDIYIEQPVYFIESESGLSVFKKFNGQALCKAYPEKSDVIRKYIRNSATGRLNTHNEIISILHNLDNYF
jgi:hypothetical protein